MAIDEGMAMTHCCELCSIYWDCQLKWYRGERGEEQTCCPLCRLFYDCNPEIADAGVEREENKEKDKKRHKEKE